MSRQVARNAVWNVSGTLAALAVGLLALPVLLHTMGAARLGVFTLALGLIGFSGLFDFGMGRALTQGVSSALGAGRSQQAVAAMVWHVLRLLVLFGLVWTVLLWLVAPALVDYLFALRGSMATETVFGLRAVALSIPFALAATGAVGALEGLQRFRQISSWRAAMSVVQFGLPTLVALWHPNVGWVIAGLAATRVVSLVVWLRVLQRSLPADWRATGRGDDLRHLLRFGGWLSVSNVIGPLMTYADRFYLISQFPPAAVVHYTVPYDAVFRTTALPGTAMNAVFPALAAAQDQSEASDRMLRGAGMAVVALMLPPVLLAAIFARPLLTFWLGASFAAPATPVLKLLLLGIFLNSCAHVPYAYLQANGRSDRTAQLHLAELPIFAVLLVWAIHAYGVTGAALAWTSRVALDTGLLYWSALRLQRRHRAAFFGNIALTGVGFLGLAISTYTDSLKLRLVIVVLVLGACGNIVYRLWRRWRRSPRPSMETEQ